MNKNPILHRVIIYLSKPNQNAEAVKDKLNSKLAFTESELPFSLLRMWKETNELLAEHAHIARPLFLLHVQLSY